MRSLTPLSGERIRTNREADITALLGAFCFFLSTIEYMIPKPLPFLRLGIANLPILLAVDILPLPWYLILAVVKVIGMSLVSGSLVSFTALFSFAGTMAAALVMWTARKLGRSAISAIGVSVLGAAASNAVQIALASAVIFGTAAVIITPVFLGAGLLTGLFLGIFAERFVRTSCWLALVTGRELPADSRVAETDAPPGAEPRAGRLRGRSRRLSGETASGGTARMLRSRRYGALVNPAFLAAAGLAVSIAFLLQRDIMIRTLMCACFFMLSFLSGKKVSVSRTLFVMLGIVLVNLAVPVGKVLGYAGPFAITETALLDGIGKAVVFEGLIFLSQATILPALRIPGRLGSIVSSAFTYYNGIIEHRDEIHPASVLRDADRLMLRLWKSSTGRSAAFGEPDQKAPSGTHTGTVLVVAAALVSYALLFI